MLQKIHSKLSVTDPRIEPLIPHNCCPGGASQLWVWVEFIRVHPLQPHWPQTFWFGSTQYKATNFIAGKKTSYIPFLTLSAELMHVWLPFGWLFVSLHQFVSPHWCSTWDPYIDLMLLKHAIRNLNQKNFEKTNFVTIVRPSSNRVVNINPVNIPFTLVTRPDH